MICIMSIKTAALSETSTKTNNLLKRNDMKAKVIETGEEITIIGISKEWGTAQYYGSDGIYRQRTFRDKEIELIDTTDALPIDWEQRRYEIAKAAMVGVLAFPVVEGVNPNPNMTEICKLSVNLADELIEELKKDE